MDTNKPLIQEIKEAGELIPINGGFLRTYYTCARYNDVELGPSIYDEVSRQYKSRYGPGQWSCVKGLFEYHPAIYDAPHIESKVLSYSKFRDTNSALKKDLGGSYTLFIANN